MGSPFTRADPTKFFGSAGWNGTSSPSEIASSELKTIFQIPSFAVSTQRHRGTETCAEKCVFSAGSVRGSAADFYGAP